jgi:hypothetical protein
MSLIRQVDYLLKWRALSLTEQLIVVKKVGVSYVTVLITFRSAALFLNSPSVW